MDNMQTEQDPMQVLNDQFTQTQDYIKQQAAREEDLLRHRVMPDKNFNDELLQLRSKHEGLLAQEKFKLQQQMGQVQKIQSLADAGQIEPDAANEAKWRLVLPLNAETAMFPKRFSTDPYPQGTIESRVVKGQEANPVLKNMIDYAESAEPESKDVTATRRGRGSGLFNWFEKEAKDIQSLLDKYQEWQTNSGYNYLNNPVKQGQLDTQWDAYMRSDSRFENWFSDEKKRKPIAEVQALRSTGQIGRAMKSRLIDVSSNMSSSPMASSIRTKIPAAPLGVVSTPQPKRLDKQTAVQILRRAGGDKDRARQMAVQMGYAL